MNKKMEWKRTHYCNDLRVEDVDREVVLMGWCKTRRDHGGVIFVDLRGLYWNYADSLQSGNQ